VKGLRVSAAAERDLDDIWHYVATNSGSLRFWKEYGLKLRANYVVLLSRPTLPIASWCLVLAGGALKAAKRLYSNR